MSGIVSIDVQPGDEPIVLIIIHEDEQGAEATMTRNQAIMIGHALIQIASEGDC